MADRLDAIVREELAELLRGGWGSTDDDRADLPAAELALREADAQLEAAVGDVALRMTLDRLGPSHYERHISAHIDAVEHAQVAYREAASQAARAGTMWEPQLVLDADAGELGELARAALDAVIVQRGRGPIESRVQILVKTDPAHPGLTTSQHP